MELLGGQLHGPLPVGRVAQHGEGGAQRGGRQAQHALDRRGRERDAGDTQAAVEQELRDQPAERVAHDDRRRVEPADDLGVVIGDLRYAEPIHG